MDFKTFLITIRRFATHAMMRLIVMPLIFLVYGIVFGIKIGNVNVLGTVVLFVFVLLMQLLEQYFYLQQTKKGYINWKKVYPIMGIIGILIIALFPLTNFIFMILALTYFVSLLLIYGFFKLRGSVYFIILQVFLKGLVLTVLSAFMQVNFISYDLLFATLPLVCALLFYYSEIEMIELRQFKGFHGNKQLLNIFSVLGILGTLAVPVLIGTLKLTNIIGMVIWIIVCALLAKVMYDNRRKIHVATSKNFMATMYILVVIIYCFI